ncbi:MAG: DUF2344 domain-containing protein [Planctomycetes bacterium]|nr:DUF2344 domain-containing protein [Planctomycetota bacterium]
MQELVDKISYRFEKTGAARFFSHHDLMRFFRRAVSRAELPVRMTSGFNPQMRMVFPHALGLGTSSLCETIEMEFYEKVDSGKAAAALGEATEPLLHITSAVAMAPSKHGGQVKNCTYCASGFGDVAPDALVQAVADVMAKGNILLERGIGPKRREVDVRPYLEGLEAKGDRLFIRLGHTPTGAGRAAEIVEQVCKLVGIDPAEIDIQKIDMELSYG